MNSLLPIGQFARVTRLSVKQLRHYDELGLLQPALVDASNGYRYYGHEQLRDALRIRTLRDLEMPLEEIRAVLREQDPEQQRALYQQHAQRLHGRMNELRRALERLQRVERGVTQPYTVRLTELPARYAISRQLRTGLSDLPALMGPAYEALYAWAGRSGNRVTGAPFAVYPVSDLTQQDEWLVELGVPVLEALGAPPGGLFRLWPASRALVTTHEGPYDGIGGAYAALSQRLGELGWTGEGSPRETYLVGPAQTDDVTAFRTEVHWPVPDIVGWPHDTGQER